MKKLNVSFLLLFLLAVSCNQSAKQEKDESNVDQSATVEKETEQQLNSAKAVISSASGSTLSGEAVFTELEGGNVSFKLTVENATPGEHAVHLHEKGDCSAPDASSAGGHWNPAEMPHGKRAENMKYHAGDIDNLIVGEDGKGEISMTITGWTIGGPDSSNVINKAVVVHAQADDFESQPSGAAGKREGCGVIEKQ